MKLYHLLVLFISLVFLSACQQRKQEIELPFQGQLVFIEDLDGSGGRLSGSFGDIVLLDGKQNLRKLLTNDSYYNDYPTWAMRGGKVWFESKRSRNIAVAGLSADSYLYQVDIKTGSMSKVNSIPEFPPDYSNRIMKPAISPSGQRVVFESSSNLILANLETKVSRVLELGEYQFYDRTSWSPEDSLIAFAFTKKGIVYDIGLLSLPTDSVKIITQTYYKGPHAGEGAVNCEVGNWASSGDFFIYACSELGVQKSNIHRYNLDAEKTLLIKEVEDHIVYSPQISADQSKIFYIAGEGNTEWNDIFMYDLDRDTTIRITTNHNHKSHLIYRPNPN